MAFRDKDLALRSRVDDLEQEVEALRRENDELKTDTALQTTAAPRQGWAIPGATAGLIVASIIAALAIVASAGSELAVVFVPLASLLITAAALFFVVSQLLYVASPNEVLVISGRQTRSVDGSLRGYRTVRGGRALKLPLLEQVERMDLSNITLEITLRGAYSKSGEVNVNALAVVRIANADPLLSNAIERFLGQSHQQVADVAEQTLEGVLRGVVSQLTLDELSEDALNVANVVIEEAHGDFSTLGLELDVFKIADVSATEG